MNQISVVRDKEPGSGRIEVGFQISFDDDPESIGAAVKKVLKLLKANLEADEYQSLLVELSEKLLDFNKKLGDKTAGVSPESREVSHPSEERNSQA